MKRPINISYQYIKERIIKGSYYPSEKLNESDLANEIGVSRNTVKKALLKLAQEFLVVIEDNKGAYVKAYNVQEIAHHFEIREIIEGLIVESATVRMTDEDLLNLRNLFNKMTLHCEANEFEQYAQCDSEFHEIIYSAAENQEAVRLVKSISIQLARFYLRIMLLPNRCQSSLEEHKAVLEAIESRNVEEASAAIRKHIQLISKAITENYFIIS